MATRKTTETVENNAEIEIVRQMHELASQGEWEVVVEETPTQVILETGDVFVGFFQGEYSIDDPNGGDPFVYLRFTGPDEKPYAISKGYKLAEAFDKIDVGTLCRITVVKEIDRGSGRNPMKDYQVAIKK